MEYNETVCASVAEDVRELWQEYENNSSPEAKLVKDFDKVSVQAHWVVFTCSVHCTRALFCSVVLAAPSPFSPCMYFSSIC